MIKSMTGFGSVVVDEEAYMVNVEVKVLNSKYMDLSAKISNSFGDKEIEVRNRVTKVLERGKVSLLLSFVNKVHTAERVVVNRGLVRQYFEDLRSVAREVGADEQDLFRMAMMMPDAYVAVPVSRASEDEWRLVCEALEEALRRCEAFRVKEGQVLEGVLSRRWTVVEWLMCV
jgi:uncharacterized protein (TIGR00255 family)